MLYKKHSYGLLTNLIDECDVVYVKNRLLSKLGIDDYMETEDKRGNVYDLRQILMEITDYAVGQGIIDDSITYRDMFDTEIMDVLTPYPDEVFHLD